MKTVRVTRTIEYSGNEEQVKAALEEAFLTTMKTVEVGRMVRATGHHPSGAVDCTIRLINDSWDYFETTPPVPPDHQLVDPEPAQAAAAIGELLA